MDVADGRADPVEVTELRTSLAFAAFALSHAACGETPVEVRIGERCLIEWCPDCAELGTFLSPRV